MLATGCDAPPPATPAAAGQQGVPAELSVAGRIEAENLDEISGMARSVREPGLYWVHNDSGDKARLHAIDDVGRIRARLKLDDADNVDWEDIASFSLEGMPYLLVADIGNNEGKRSSGTLYVIAEPDLTGRDEVSAPPAWRIDFRYPDAAHDAEAIAVDAGERAVYLLTKRDLPPQLFRVPLESNGPALVVAEHVGPLATLPSPSRNELEFAPISNEWHWQPTAMDAAADGRFVVILTYGAVYYYSREPGATIADALQGQPLRFGLRRVRGAEAIAVSADGRQLFLTVEQRGAPLFRIDLGPTTGD